MSALSSLLPSVERWIFRHGWSSAFRVFHGRKNGKPKSTGKKRSKPDTPADSDGDMEEVVVPAIRDIKGKGRAIDSDGGYVVSDGSRSSTTGSPSVNGKGKGKGKRKATPAVRLRKPRPKLSAQESLEGSVQVSLSSLTPDS
jgi:hypothetical protein